MDFGGRDVNERDEDGSTLLLDAISSRDAEESAPETVRLLIAAGASVTMADRWDRTPLYWSALLSKSGENQNSIINFWILTNKFHLELVSIVEILIEKGPSGVERAVGPDKYGRRALHSAQLEHVNNSDRFGMSPLHSAARNRHQSAPHVVRLLLDRGARVTVRDQWGRSPLHLAAENPSKWAVDIVAVLLEHDAQVEQLDGVRLTAVSYAQLNRSKSSGRIVQLLEEKLNSNQSQHA